MFRRISRPSAPPRSRLAAVFASDFAWADACDNAVNGSIGSFLDDAANFAKHFTMGSLAERGSAAISQQAQAARKPDETVAFLPLMRRGAEAACGSRLRTKCKLGMH